MPPSSAELALLARHQERVRALVRALLRDEHAAEDVVQDAWVRAIERGPDEPRALAAWFGRVARRLALNRLRGGTRRARRERAAARPEAIPSSAQVAARVELERRVVDAIAALDEPHRSALTDRYLGELTPTEVSRRDGVPLDTVKSRLARARRALRERLDREEFEGGAHWSVALLPLAAGRLGPGAPPVVEGGAIPATAAPLAGASLLGTLAVNKLLLAAAALAAVVLTLRAVAVDDPPSPDGTSRSAAAAPRGPSLEPVTEPAAEEIDVAPPDAPRPPRAVPTDPAPPEPAAAAWRIAGTVAFSGDDAPPPRPVDVRLELFDGHAAEGEPLAVRTVVTDRLGGFDAGFEAPAGTVTVVATVAEPDLLQVGGPGTTAPAGEEPSHLWVRLERLDAKLVGTVRAPDGTPVGGARVRWNRFEVTADPGGEFEIDVASRWEFHVLAFADGYGQAVEVFEGLEPGDAGRLDLTLTPELVLRGAVVDERGLAVAGARVHTFYGREIETTSDASGRYELRHLPHGVRDRVLVYASKPGFVRAEERREPGDARELEVDLELRRGAALAGVVVDEGGAPVPGVEVWLGQSRYDGGRLTATTDDDGRFAWDAAPAGNHQLVATRRGSAPARVDLSIPEGARSHPDIELRLVPGRVLRGVVRDAGDEPVAGLGVAARSRGDYVGSQGGTDGDGRFELHDLPPGPLEVEVYGSGVVRLTRPVPEPLRGELQLVVERAGSIAGRVVDGATGEAVPSFTIRLVDPILAPGDERVRGYAATWGRQGKSFDDGEGRFTTAPEAFRPGRVVGVEASASGYAPRVVPRAVVDADAELVVELWRSVDVELLARLADGEPVPPARVVLSQERRSDEYDHRWTGTTDASGVARVAGVAPGPIFARVEREARPTERRGPFDVPHAARLHRLELVLAEGATVVGSVYADGGEPAAGTSVRATAIDVPGAEVDTRIETVADAAGRFRFDGLAPGRWQVGRLAGAGERAPQDLWTHVVVAPDDDRVERDLVAARDGGVVAGRVAAPAPLPDHARVSLVARDADAAPAGRSATVVDGAFELVGVAPGAHLATLDVFDAGTKRRFRGAAEVVVEAGGRHVVDLELEEVDALGR